LRAPVLHCCACMLWPANSCPAATRRNCVHVCCFLVRACSGLLTAVLLPHNATACTCVAFLKCVRSCMLWCANIMLVETFYDIIMVRPMMQVKNVDALLISWNSLRSVSFVVALHGIMVFDQVQLRPMHDFTYAHIHIWRHTHTHIWRRWHPTENQAPQTLPSGTGKASEQCGAGVFCVPMVAVQSAAAIWVWPAARGRCVLCAYGCSSKRSCSDTCEYDLFASQSCRCIWSMTFEVVASEVCPLC